MYIDGCWVESETGDRFKSYNPASGEIIGEVPDGTASDTNKAIQAASNAFAGWSSLTAYQRAEFLYECHSLMIDNLETLAEVTTEEQGKPLRAARNEVRYGADFLQWFAEEAKRVYGRTIPSARTDQRFITIRQPVGIVAAITPWNYPISMITRKAAPALAAGCTIVVKPAEATPLCAKAVFEIFDKAGLPPGVANLITAQDPEPVGAAMMGSSEVKKLTFTGSTEVGRLLAREAGFQLKRISLELGGHAPYIVCRDADPVHAAKGLVLVKFLNTGQACISPNRVYVHEDMMEPFVGELKKRVEQFKVGSGLDSAVKIGPLVNREEYLKIDAQVRDALDKGATLVAGGTRLTDNNLHKGYFYAPTILSDVNASMKIYREETFGPVAPIITYRDEDTIVENANDTNYGLAAYVYTRDLSKAFTIAERLNFGIIGINDINPTSVAAPFGGMKDSGIGREGATEGIEEYLEVKSCGFSI